MTPIEIDQFLQVKRILRWFALSSGLHINFHNSSIIKANVEDCFCMSLASTTFCMTDSFSCTYLGICHWVQIQIAYPCEKLVIDKFHRRLNQWKGRF
jgi:hypothetical protein